jgi:hypothetical protein
MSDLVKISRELLAACVAQDWDAAYANADPKFIKGFTEFMFAETWNRVRAVAGGLVEIAGAHELRHLLAPVRVVFLVCKFERQAVTVEVSFNETNKILGLALLTPAFGGK